MPVLFSLFFLSKFFQSGKRVAAVNVEKKGRLMSSLRARDNTLGNLTLVTDSFASAFFFSPDGKVYVCEILSSIFFYLFGGSLLKVLLV